MGFRLSVLALMGVLTIGSARGQEPMGLLGVAEERPEPVAAVPVEPAPPAVAPGAPAPHEEPEPTWEQRRELETALMRARGELKRAQERSAHLASSIPGYAPGGFWDRHYRKEVADWERSLAFAQEEVRKSRSAWSRFRRFMNTDILSGEVVGHRDDLAADSRLRMATERLAQAKAQRDKYIPEGYTWMIAEKQKEDTRILRAEAALVPLEARRQAFNARGVRIMWDDKLPDRLP